MNPSSPPPSYIEMAVRALEMKKYRVLVSVEGHRVDASKGAIISACGDCDQEKNFIGFLREVATDRLHHVRANGGPLSISSASPLHVDYDELDGSVVTVGKTQIVNIRNSIPLKETNVVVLLAHAPCGAAMATNMSLDDMVLALLEAKKELIKRYRESLGIRVACFMHVDWRRLSPALGKDPRTYFMSRERAEAWLADPPPLMQKPFPFRDVRTQTDIRAASQRED